MDPTSPNHPASWAPDGATDRDVRSIRMRLVLSWLLLLLGLALVHAFPGSFVLPLFVLLNMVLRWGIHPKFPKASARENLGVLLGILLCGLILFTFPKSAQGIAFSFILLPGGIWIAYSEYRLFRFGPTPRGSVNPANNTDDQKA